MTPRENYLALFWVSRGENDNISSKKLGLNNNTPLFKDFSAMTPREKNLALFWISRGENDKISSKKFGLNNHPPFFKDESPFQLRGLLFSNRLYQIFYPYYIPQAPEKYSRTTFQCTFGVILKLSGSASTMSSRPSCRVWYKIALSRLKVSQKNRQHRN